MDVFDVNSFLMRLFNRWFAAESSHNSSNPEHYSTGFIDSTWRVLLQHACVHTEPAVVCKLLCCSKALARTVAELCSSRLPLHVELPSAPSEPSAQPGYFQAWLSKHSQLLRYLHIHSHCPGHSGHLDCQDQNQMLELRDACITAGIRKAAQAAAATNQRLHLQSLRFLWQGCSDGLVLRHLPSSSLTELEIHLQPFLMEKQYELVMINLAGLTKLQQLALDDAASWQPYCCIPALKGLSHLTWLSLVSRMTTEELAQLPATLVQLKLPYHVQRGKQNPELLLGHLTRLLQLELGSKGNGSSQHGSQQMSTFALGSGDLLSPCLTHLIVHDVSSSRPLTSLRRLAKLTISHCTTAAGELLQLADIASLTALQLAYHEPVARIKSSRLSTSQPLETAAWVWQHLPLVHLDLLVGTISIEVVCKLGALSALTHLRIYECSVVGAQYAAQLAGELNKLASIQHLSVGKLLLQS